MSDALATSPASGSGSSSPALQRIQAAVANQQAVANARYLIVKVNEICFAHCIQAPGSSLSGGEQKCLTACMEKYFDGWNVANRTYTTRLQKEKLQMQGAAGGLPGGKELF
jgi:import inner membrane translocase subunit TIM13